MILEYVSLMFAMVLTWKWLQKLDKSTKATKFHREKTKWHSGIKTFEIFI